MTGKTKHVSSINEWTVELEYGASRDTLKSKCKLCWNQSFVLSEVWYIKVTKKHTVVDFGRNRH